jgi:hypothetical protein
MDHRNQLSPEKILPRRSFLRTPLSVCGRYQATRPAWVIFVVQQQPAPSEMRIVDLAHDLCRKHGARSWRS